MEAETAMQADSYRFGDFTINVSRGSLCCGDAAVALRPKSFALLQYLVTHAGRLVSKDELLAAVWAGVVVTEDSLTRCVSEVSAALRDHDQRAIKTVARRGYLFDLPVVAVVAASQAPAAPPEVPAADPRPGPARRAAAPVTRAMWLVLVALAVLLVYGFAKRTGTPAPRLSLVVLPFTAPGSDVSDAPQAGLADALAGALTEDLTSALARLHGTAVVATGSARTFKGPAVDARRVGTELGVRDVVEGSVQRSGGRLRVSSRLVDTRTAASLWSDQFDVDRAGLLDTQDKIVLRLANALDAELVQAHSTRTARIDATALDAEDLAMQCVALARRPGGGAAAAGYALCEQALQKDPRNARALVWLASHFADRVSRGQTLDAAADLTRASEFSARALLVDSGYAAAHCAQAEVLEGQHRVRDAVAAARRCLELNPSDAIAYRLLATQHFFLAEPEQTLAYADRGIHLSPRDPRLATFVLFKGWACLQLHRYDEAVTWLRQARATAPDSPNITLALAVALVMAGHADEGRSEMAVYLGLPRTRAKTLSQWDHRPDGNAAFAAFATQVNAALLKAGMPP